MEINTEASKKVENPWIENVIGVTEKLSALLLIVPFVSVVVGLFLENDLFFLFPLGLVLFFPAGVFALAIQIFRLIRIRKKPIITPFNGVMIGCGAVTVIIGILGLMVLYIVVG